MLQPAQITRSREWHDAARKARWLSWLSLAWMGAEGVIALTAGILAGSSRARLLRPRLVHRGLREPRHRLALHRLEAALTRRRGASAEAGRRPVLPARALRPFEAVHKLLTGVQPKTSWLGIVLVTSSVVGMPFLGIVKHRLADKLGSVATRGEGTQNLLCAYLAAAVLVGLLGNALLGFW